MAIVRQALFALALALLAGAAGANEPPAPLALESRIPLPGVVGRIDHLSVDLGRRHLFVAELGNGTVDAIDLATGAAIGRISGLEEPQGLAYVPASDLLVVATGGDGTIRMFHAADLSPAGQVPLGKDADNVRVEPRAGHVVVGYGSGGLAVVDPVRRSKLADIGLAGHPEGFQLEPESERVFVNVPDARQIAVVELGSGRQTATWRIPDRGSNFPLALDAAGSLLATVFRSPARLVLLDTKSGAVTEDLATCEDADDVFFDARRRRIYLSCGAGAVDVFQRDEASTRPLGRIRTPPGGRTSLFVPELDRLFVAVRARLLGSDASILVLRPTP